jgi:glycosyltransferase involved in cell wall biosynthesis
LINALAQRGVEQTVFIRPSRLWRDEIHGSIKVLESHFRNFTPDRLLLPLNVNKLVKDEKPNALCSWATRASRLMPTHQGSIKISRLGDYPTKLDYFKNTDVLVCNTPGIATHVRRLGWNRGVEVISNFTDLVRVEPIDRAMLRTPKSATVIMAMGRFVPRKRFTLLTEAAAKIPDAYLWLAGEGEEQANIQRVAARHGISDRVRMLGWQKDVRAFLAAADIFVMPSNHEPLGNVILEAWAQRLPVVSTRSEGPSWFMRDGENGLLVGIDDVPGLTQALRRLMDNSDLRNHIAEGGRQTLLSQFSEDAIVTAYLRLFDHTPTAFRSIMLSEMF